MSSSVIGTSRPWSLNKFIAAGKSLGVDPPMKCDSRPDGQRQDNQITILLDAQDVYVPIQCKGAPLASNLRAISAIDLLFGPTDSML